LCLTRLNQILRTAIHWQVFSGYEKWSGVHDHCGNRRIFPGWIKIEYYAAGNLAHWLVFFAAS
jgi:hypothetical protein